MRESLEGSRCEEQCGCRRWIAGITTAQTILESRVRRILAARKRTRPAPARGNTVPILHERAGKNVHSRVGDVSPAARRMRLS
jgi:hypothetical protein